jgi:hypothetical protein
MGLDLCRSCRRLGRTEIRAVRSLRHRTLLSLLDHVRSIEHMVLSLGAFEKVKLYNAGHLVEMTVA